MSAVRVRSGFPSTLPTMRMLPAVALASALSRSVAVLSVPFAFSGAAVTPFILDRLAGATGGRTIAPNLALAEHNAAVAAQLAVALASVR